MKKNKRKFNCSFCNKVTEKKASLFKNNKNNFCDKKCYINWQKQNKIINICLHCKKIINKRGKGWKFCNKEHYLLWRRKQDKIKKIQNQEIRTCICGCKTKFVCIKKSEQKYIWGHNPSETIWTKGHNPWNKNIHIQTNTGRTHFQKGLHSGKNSPSWKGGKSFEEYGPDFNNQLKEKIRFLGKYKCQLCGCSQLENGRQLDCHHIDYNKKNNKIDNLIALCKSCHVKTNNKREYWTEYFKGDTNESGTVRFTCTYK